MSEEVAILGDPGASQFSAMVTKDQNKQNCTCTTAASCENSTDDSEKKPRFFLRGRFRSATEGNVARTPRNQPLRWFGQLTSCEAQVPGLGPPATQSPQTASLWGGSRTRQMVGPESMTHTPATVVSSLLADGGKLCLRRDAWLGWVATRNVATGQGASLRDA